MGLSFLPSLLLTRARDTGGRCQTEIRTRLTFKIRTLRYARDNNSYYLLIIVKQNENKI